MEMRTQVMPVLQLPSSSSSQSLALAVFFHRYSPNGARLSARRLGIHSASAPNKRRSLVLASGEDTASTSTSVSASASPQEDEADPQDLESIRQIKRVLELLRKNRDMLFNEVKLTVMIEDPREVERRRLLGIDEQDGPTRDDLVTALEQVNEGKIPENRAALWLLAEEMIQWPNLEVEAEKKKPSKSLYAKATDTGVDPREAARRLNIDWDTAAEIEDADVKDETEVPAALGYGALYLVTAFPVIIGVSVVLILFYNSLQ
ncbi:hypothetical protein PanWU01x14_265090 [Parasponia andersonii]|uniref:Ycf3-interacting protein 1, chloroplastic n=1 Tax=Parasponia andersonii TaxID=3476 RepID=A0A2P5B754_PARAD|nr:hypothetical protein PanWU01x14_265090 [Parasponia andersonii]